MKKFGLFFALFSLLSVSIAWSQTVTQATVDAKQAEVSRLQTELQNAQADAYQAYVQNSPDLQQKQAKVNQLQSKLTKAQDEAYKAMQALMAQQQSQQQPQQQQVVNNQQPSYNQQQTQQNQGSGSDVVFFQVKTLLDGGLFKNEMQIAQMSPQLNATQKMMLFNSYQKSAGGPFALNFFIGLGIGSAVQGDLGGWGFQFATEGIGWIFILAGVSGEEIKPGAIGFGAFLMSIGQIFGWIRPFVYANKYNRTLQNALNGGSPMMMFSFAPVIDPVNEKYGLMAKLNL
ncbi:MAG: P13 family porin [Treponema sp.]|nr:P13 family porin [Treponema sp.]